MTMITSTTKSKQTSAFMQDMVGCGASIIHKFADLPPDSAEQIAHHIASDLIKHWGGSMLYIPKIDHSQLHKRDLQIWQDFTGNNHHELSRKYNLSTVTIYQILAKVRKSLPNKQGDLFD